MTKLKFLPIPNTILIILGLLFIAFHVFNEKQDIIYVDNVKLFNEFNMTKEIKASEEIKINALKKELDSLFDVYKMIVDKESLESKQLQYQIELKNRSFQDIQNNYTTNLTQQVWVRLNGYLNEYGETNDLQFIIGSNNSAGNVLYSNSNHDLTKEILTYINQKYEGNLIR